jgi:hypothetical protein
MHVNNFFQGTYSNNFLSLAWQLRYNGIGGNVYKGKDNSDVGDGMENVYQQDSSVL